MLPVQGRRILRDPYASSFFEFVSFAGLAKRFCIVTLAARSECASRRFFLRSSKNPKSDIRAKMAETLAQNFRSVNSLSAAATNPNTAPKANMMHEIMGMPKANAAPKTNKNASAIPAAPLDAVSCLSSMPAPIITPQDCRAMIIARHNETTRMATRIDPTLWRWPAQ
jgi:hypothetical protein